MFISFDDIIAYFVHLDFDGCRKIFHNYRDVMALQ